MKEPILFIADAFCDSEIFAPQLIALGREYDVILSRVLSADRIVDIARQKALNLPRRVNVVGYGLGAHVALELARLAPEHVSRIALISADIFAQPPQVAAQRETRIIDIRSGRFETAVRHELAYALGIEASNTLDQNPLFAALQAMAYRLGEQMVLDHVRLLQRRTDLQSHLRKLRIPCAVIAGRNDPILPVKRIELTAELAPMSHLTILDGVGHFPTWEAPDAVTECLRAWLKLQPAVHNEDRSSLRGE